MRGTAIVFFKGGKRYRSGVRGVGCGPDYEGPRVGMGTLHAARVWVRGAEGVFENPRWCLRTGSAARPQPGVFPPSTYALAIEQAYYFGP